MSIIKRFSTYFSSNDKDKIPVLINYRKSRVKLQDKTLLFKIVTPSTSFQMFVSRKYLILLKAQPNSIKRILQELDVYEKYIADHMKNDNRLLLNGKIITLETQQEGGQYGD